MNELTFARTWLPFLYLYGVGGIAFILAIILVVRTKAINLKLLHHRKWLVVLLAGMAWFVGIHGAFTLFAIGS